MTTVAGYFILYSQDIYLLTFNCSGSLDAEAYGKWIAKVSIGPSKDSTAARANQEKTTVAGSKDRTEQL